jgi:aryl-alcohol dehydrogenase-like predicted oxidoreductase
VAGDRYYAGAHSPENLARVAQLRNIAREQDLSVAGLALAWLRSNPAVTASIVSPSTDAQWQAVREAASTRVDPETLTRVAAIFAR